MRGVPKTFGRSTLKSKESDMEREMECAVLKLLRQIKDRITEEAEYDYEAKEIVHKIDRILVGKLPQKNCNQIKEALVKKLDKQ